MRVMVAVVVGGLVVAAAVGRPAAATEEVRVAQAVQTLPGPIERGRSGTERGDARDRERARRECAREAERRDFTVRGSTPARGSEGRRLQLRMDLARRGERWIGTCTFDTRDRRAELETRRVRPDRPGGGGGSGSGGGASASNREVSDACIREVSQNARTQLVSAGRVERRSGGASVMPMTIRVEGNERRVRCFHDNATGAVTIR